MIKNLAITPSLLHKDHLDDVLIKNPSPLLPIYLTTAEFDSIASIAAKEELATLLQHYHSSNSVYLLPGISAELQEEQLTILEHANVRVAQKHKPNITNINSRILPATILQALYPDHLTITESDSIILQELFARQNTLNQTPVFSYSGHIDTSNYFFYRKSHEHVPGLMLIEMARQAMYHYLYSYSEHQRGEVSISMNNLEISFSQYVISSYGLEILVCNNEETFDPTPQSVDKTAYFYQNGHAVAKVRLRGSVINMKTFKRLRHIKFPEEHWFSPNHSMINTAIISDANGHCQTTKILGISSAGIRINNHPFSQYCQISIATPDKRYIILPLQAQGKIKESYVELSFAQLNKTLRHELQDLIKCSTTVIDARPSSQHSTQKPGQSD